MVFDGYSLAKLKWSGKTHFISIFLVVIELQASCKLNLWAGVLGDFMMQCIPYHPICWVPKNGPVA